MLGLVLAALLAMPGTVHARSQRPSPSDDDQVQTKGELSEDDVRQQVNAYLGSIDTGIEANQWRSLGPRAVPMLERIVTNRDELPTRRAKAIDGLAAVGDTSASSLFNDIARNDGESINVRFAAVRGLARMTPHDRAAEVLKPIANEVRRQARTI